MDTAAAVSLGIAIGGLVLNLLGFIIAGVWVVAKISGTTSLLTQSITSLKESIEHLRNWVECVDDRTDQHTEKIARMEAKLGTRSGNEE